MTRACACAALLLSAACEPKDDLVFVVRGLDGGAVSVAEGAGAVDIPIALSVASGGASARYRLRELEAQSGCQTPDFTGADGRVTWNDGERVAFVSLWIGDDDLAELDESFAIELDDFQGVQLDTAEQRVVILDDERTGLVDAAAFGLGTGGDESRSLQEALERARELGRGVVVIPAGDYEVGSVNVPSGVSLSARGARFHRPVGVASDTVTVRIADAARGARTLVEGLTIYGRRDRQGPFRDNQLADAHLVAIDGDPANAARLGVSLEGLRLESGTASGVFVGRQADATLCRIQGHDLWRDVVTLRGGGSRISLRDLDGSASDGTTGLWFDGQPAGFGGTHRIEVSVENAPLASGDLEIEAYDGSVVELSRFSMTRGPLRLQAPDARVRIEDSVLELGVPSDTHNFFALPHDVEITDSALVVSETNDEGLPAAEMNRELAIVQVRFELAAHPELPALLPAAEPPHQLKFVGCSFSRGADLESTDITYAVATSGNAGNVLLERPALAGGVAPFAPSCETCRLEP